VLTPLTQCDRTKPCSACCARGLPGECRFIVAEGADCGPVQQSYRLRMLEAENKRLKECLQAYQFELFEDAHHTTALSSLDSAAIGRNAFRVSLTPSTQWWRRFRSRDPADSLYFGRLGFASVINDVRLCFFLVCHSNRRSSLNCNSALSL